MKRNLDAVAYVIVEGRRPSYGSINAETGEKDVDLARVVGVRARRPGTLSKNQIAVKLTLTLPNAIFDNPIQAVAVVVPEDYVIRQPIIVTADDPEGD